MKIFNCLLLTAFALLTGLTSSCIYFNRLQYIEPVTNTNKNWEKAWEKDALGFKNFHLKKVIKDSVGNELGVLLFEFYGNESMFSKSKYFTIGLTLNKIDNHFMKLFDIDSTDSRKIRDSLARKKIGTGVYLPYKGFYLVSSDSTRIPLNASEFFLNYPPEIYRSFRLGGKVPFKDNTELKIVTGDAYLDKILKQDTFIFKTKRKVDFMTHMN